MTAIDAYADLDLAAIARTRRVAPYTPGAIALAGQAASCDAICYVSNIENHPAVLRRLLSGRPLWGNAAATLVLVRDPAQVAHTLGAPGVEPRKEADTDSSPEAAGEPGVEPGVDPGVVVPRVRASAPRAGTAAAEVRWLLKPRASGGGQGIHPWHPGLRVTRGHILQERIAGSPASILFVADGRACVPFAVTRQLIGDRHFGAAPYRYCGNILPPADDARWGLASPLWRGSRRIAEVATRAFGLVGVNGVDFIAQHGVPVPIEVNPRFTAAMELAERRDGLSVFAAHVAGCTDRLTELSIPGARGEAFGKALVFARRPVTVGDTRQWLDDPDIRDVPNPGSYIGQGSPICTVFASGRTTAECYARLTQRADDIYASIEASKR